MRQLDGALIVADETPAGDYLVTAIIGVVAVAVAGLLICWLFPPPFRWLGYGLVILTFVRAFQLIIKGGRQPQRWEFLRACEEIRQNGKKIGRFEDLSEIVIITAEVTYFNPDPSRNFKNEFHFAVQLRIADCPFGLGSCGAEYSAIRLGKAIAGFLNKPLQYRRASPVVNT